MLNIPLAPLSVVTAVETTNGSMVVFVSRRFGHANPNITLDTHAHAATARAALETSYATITATDG